MIASHFGSSAEARSVRRIPSHCFREHPPLKLDFLAVGHTGVFIEFDGPAADYAVA
jgi:hypothetical protein